MGPGFLDIGLVLGLPLLAYVVWRWKDRRFRKLLLRTYTHESWGLELLREYPGFHIWFAGPLVVVDVLALSLGG